MSPTVLKDDPYRLFFFSREEKRVHIHVAHADGEAKFWLTPEITLVSNTGLSAKQLREARIIVQAHLKEIRNAWSQHFGG
jgi:ribosomal protein L16/L10AE